MPIYEYVCTDCREKFEVLRAISAADDPIECNFCGSDQTSRAITMFYAKSGGRVVAGGNSACSTCSSSACATCKI